MSTQVLKATTLGQALDEVDAESILDRFDALIGEMTQLRQLIQGLIPAKPATVDLKTTEITADKQDWVEELYGSLAPPQPRSLADELEFYHSMPEYL